MLVALAAAATLACQNAGPRSDTSGNRSNDGLAGIPPEIASTPAPMATPAPPPRGVFSEGDLGYLMVAPGKAIKGVVSGPETLIGNTGAALIGNTGAALIGNTGAALIGNTGAALTQNAGNALGSGAGSTFRIGAVQARVANGFVYLTAPDERFYVDAERRLYGTVTDADGAFTLAAPATDSVLVNVLLEGNRRLSAIVVPGSEDGMDVGLASTLVAEYIRAKGVELGFSFVDAVGSPEARAALGRLTALTRALFEKDSALAWLRTDDFVINNLPLLRQHYVAAFGTAEDRSLSDEWTAFFKLVKRDEAAPDVKYRPLALTTLKAGIPVGNRAVGVAADQAGNVIISEFNRSSAAIRLVPPAGEPRALFVKPRIGADSMALVSHLAVTPGGKILLPDSTRGVIGLLDLGAPILAQPVMDLTRPERWTNPAFLLDANYVTGGANASDVVLDDAPDPGLYFVDPGSHAVWYVPKALSAPPTAEGSVGPFAGVPGEIPAGAPETVPASKLADLKFNQPSALAFHRRKSDGKAFLYVSDSGDQTIVEIDLESKAVRRIAGIVPPPNGPYYRKPLCYGLAEEGGDPGNAHLRFPQKILFDARERLVIADSDNSLVRIADIYSPTPRIWAIAGIAQPDDDSCGLLRKLPPHVREDGEARSVAIGLPLGMALDRDGNLLIADQTDRVRKLWLSFLK